MEQFDVLVIGFGKAGKTLAAKMSMGGKKVAIVEQDTSMYGGTCINIGCIPTKTLIVAAEENLSFEQAMAQKEAVVTRLRGKNKLLMENAGVTLINGKARFTGDKIVEVIAGDETLRLTAETIIINTGAESVILPIEGLTTSQHVYDSTGIQQLTAQPKHLGIIGGGNIGLEFASLYADLGSKVTVFEASERVLGRYEPEVADLAKTYMEEDGVDFVLSAKVSKVSNVGDKVLVIANNQEFTFDALLYATGRKPNTADLGLESTSIEMTERGAIKVDHYCETTVPGVYAVGDVNGGPQFTYTSLDDFRIVFGKLTGNGNYSLQDRSTIATTSFIRPALSQVGLTEQEAADKGYNYKANSLLVANMPRAHVNNNLRGMFKVVVDMDSRLILGATLLSAESQEIINLIKMAIDNKIPYTYIKNQLFTHPTMSENLNDVFNF
ncbi:FAD-containing oxidoreductase [Streptococcus fryi]